MQWCQYFHPLSVKDFKSEKISVVWTKINSSDVSYLKGYTQKHVSVLMSVFNKTKLYIPEITENMREINCIHVSCQLFPHTAAF